MTSFETETVHISLKKHDIKSKTTPIYQTSAFAFHSLAELESFYHGQSDYLYTRVGNPNVDEFAQAVAKLEKAEDGVATASGMSAIFAAVVAVCSAGDHIVACDDLYGGTYQLLAHELTTFGIETTFIDFTDRASVEAAIRPTTKLLYTETITNPLLRVEHIPTVVDIAKQYELVTIVDNTFATPYLLTPHEAGIDIVVHSGTKYFGGHSDATSGVVVGRKRYIQKARAKMVNLGMNLSPFEGWLASRGMKTLALRMAQHNANAQAVADALRGYPGVDRVYYPETKVSPNGSGAIVSIDITDSCDIETFFTSLTWMKIAPTLAGVESSVSYPKGTSHRAIPVAKREQLGIRDGLVRISIGIEDDVDIIAELKQAIDAARK